MGKIKSKLIKRTANAIVNEGIGFNEEFEKNKRILKDTMPSKKLRNQIAGYLVRLKEHEREKQEKLSIR